MGKRGKSDFTKPNIRRLREEVSNRCCEPDCRVICVAKGDDEKENLNIVGEAAHICAASPGGARYDSSMTDEERGSIENGIWLCSIHADEIDKDESRFPVELLQRWKTDAVKIAKKELGRPLPKESDATNLLTTALTGAPLELSHKAMSHISEAVSTALMDKDSRFDISADYISGNTVYNLSAKEDVNLMLNIDSKYYPDLKEHQESGKELLIPTNAIKIDGSPLFDEILKNKTDGIFKMGAKQIDAVFKCLLTNNGEVFSLDDIHGNISLGSKRSVFNGTGFDRLLRVEIIFEYSESKTNMNLSLDMEHWSGQPLKEIQHTKEIKEMFEKIIEDWDMELGLKVKSRNLLSGSNLNQSDNESFKDIHYFADYFYSTNRIASHFDIDFLVPDEFEIKHEDFLSIKDALAVIESGVLLIPLERFNSAPKANFTLDDKITRMFETDLNSGKPQSFALSDEEEYLNLFGALNSIGRRYYRFENCYINSHQDLSEINIGDELSVFITFDDESKCYLTYDDLNIAVS